MTIQWGRDMEAVMVKGQAMVGTPSACKAALDKQRSIERVERALKKVKDRRVCYEYNVKGQPVR